MVTTDVCPTFPISTCAIPPATLDDKDINSILICFIRIYANIRLFALKKIVWTQMNDHKFVHRKVTVNSGVSLATYSNVHRCNSQYFAK